MKKITLFLIIVLALTIVPGTIFAAEVVSTEEQFITAVDEGKSVEIRKDISIKLEKDIIVAEKVTIGTSSSNNTVTLDLNGHTVKLDGSNAQFVIAKKGTLIIEDSVGTGLITNKGNTASSAKYPIQVIGKCQINGGKIENTLSGNVYTVHIQRDAICTLNNGTIINSYEKGGRAVNISVGTFIMNGGKVENIARGDGLTSAIEGHKVIMNGGTIEAAGTGIIAAGQSVEITGGTINAGLFGVYATYATINPAEGKEVNITAERAAVIAQREPTLGDGNKIYGGNFNCPVFETKGYQGSVPTNMKIYGGIFTHDVPAELVAPGYVVNKVNDKYEVELNTPNIVDDNLEADDEVEMGVTPEVKEKLEELFKKEIEENEKIQKALLERKEVNIHIQMEKVEEDDIKEELNKIKETSKDKKLAKFYDITLVVKADDTQIDTISETSSKLKFKVSIPEELIKDGRTFFMYRYHEIEGEGKVEEITGEVTQDNYFVFESDKFSTYVLAYEDKAEEQDNTTPPTNEGETGDNTTPPTNEGETGDNTTPPTSEGETGDNTTPPTSEGGEGEAIPQPGEKPTTPDVPKTADNIFVFAIFAVVAIVGMAVAIKFRKK